MTMRTTSLLLTLSLATATTAQTTLVLPAAFDKTYGRSSTSALGGSSTRTQMVFASPFALGTSVLGFGLRGTGATADRAAFTADVEVQVSSSPNAPGALAAAFASNIGSDVVVALPRQTVNIAAMPANRSTGVFAQMPFQAPFVFGTNSNPNLMFDLFVYGRSAGASWSTDRSFASANGLAATVGRGCGVATINSTSTNGTYVLGSTVNLMIANATPNGLCWLLPSVDMKELVPGVPLPFPLSGLGAGAGCDLLVNPLLNIPTLADGVGAATISLTLGGLQRAGTAWQWLYTVPPSASNPLGLETTAARKVFIGPEICVPTAQYVWDLSNVNSLTGTNTTDSVPIVQIITP